MSDWVRNLARQAFLAGQARGNHDTGAFELWWESDSPSAMRVRAAIVSDKERVRMVIGATAMTGICEAISWMMGPTYWFDNPSAHSRAERIAADIATRVADQLVGTVLSAKERIQTTVAAEILALMAIDGPVTTEDEVNYIASRVADLLVGTVADEMPAPERCLICGSSDLNPPWHCHGKFHLITENTLTNDRIFKLYRECVRALGIDPTHICDAEPADILAARRAIVEYLNAR